MAQTEVETPFDTEKPAPKPPKKKTGRPPKSAEATNPPKSVEFFQQVADIPFAEWGNRASVHLYRCQPYTDRNRTGNPPYVMKYEEAVTLDKILNDHGSGSYRAYLNFRKPSGSGADLVNKVDFELMNLQYPPKIAPGDWVDDPRNKKWAWAKPKMNAVIDVEAAPATPPQSKLEEVSQILKVGDEIRKSAMEDVRASQPATTQSDPLEAGLKIAQTLLTLRSDNPMVDILRDEMKELRQQNATLQAELRRPRETESKGGLAGVIEQAEGLQKLKSIFNPEKEESLVESVAGAMKNGRGPRTTWLDIGLAVFPKVAEAFTPIANALAMRMMQPQPVANGTQHAQPAQQQTAAPQLPPHIQAVLPLVEKITPTMLAKLNLPAEGAELGEEFAGWVFEGHGIENLKQLQAIGAETIVTMYRGSPIWAAIQSEAKFRSFVEAFCKWSPDEEEDEPEFEGVSGSTEIDLENV